MHMIFLLFFIIWLGYTSPLGNISWSYLPSNIIKLKSATCSVTMANIFPHLLAIRVILYRVNRLIFFVKLSLMYFIINSMQTY